MWLEEIHHTKEARRKKISLAKVELNIGSNANPRECFKFQRKLSQTWCGKGCEVFVSFYLV